MSDVVTPAAGIILPILAFATLVVLAIIPSERFQDWLARTVGGRRSEW